MSKNVTLLYVFADIALANLKYSYEYMLVALHESGIGAPKVGQGKILHVFPKSRLPGTR